MTLERREQIQRALQEMQRTRGMGPLKRLFLTELEYDPANLTLFRDEWTESARDALAEDAQIVFAAGNADDPFYVIYCRLADEHNRMLLTKERAVITYLVQRYPYALFVFNSRDQDQWHFVNVKYDKNDRARRLFRRISVSRFERLRTAVDRISELSVRSMPRDLFGLSAFQVQQAHDKAFDVEKVTKDFFIAYKRSFDDLQADLHQQTRDLRWAHDYALQFLNRIMFLYFVQRKLWLRTEVGPKGDPDFVNTFWQMYQQHSKAADTFYSRWLIALFFNAFNQGEKDEDDPAWAHLPPSLRKSMAEAPYLNGGLFRENDLDKRRGFVITDDRFRRIFEFLERYNFTISEDTPLDQEVAVDPEMIGKVYESLVNVSEDGTTDERSEAGIFYTPRTEIDLMCRLSLVDWLSNHLGDQHKPLLYDVVFAFTEDEKAAADAGLRQLNFWPQVQNLLNTMQVLDPACGSGSFLVGMLIVLDDLHQRADHELGIMRRPYDRRRDIIGRNLYGVDVKDWAVHVAELRLWLQLVIETEITSTEAKVRPLLPNLSFKIRCGDSLVQEVGGINLAVRHSGFMSDGIIAGRINQLRGEKLNYYTNATGNLTLKQLQDKEHQVFADLLEARRTKTEARLDKIAKALSKTTDLFGNEANVTQSAADRSRFERQREQLKPELEQVKRALDALKTVHDVPFVWDIAFVEVFESERRGFDIVIGNPPYVRHEEIRDPQNELTNGDYKARLARAVYSAWPQTFGYYQSSKKKKWTLDAKSDLYIYFYFHALSLLNERGTFCFVTSNSWLDVGYGRDLQEFLLTRGRVKLVVDNQKRRSFASADVNTVIVLLGAANDSPQADSKHQNHTAKFLTFTVPFEVVIGADMWAAVESSERRETTPEYRIYLIKQSELLVSGTDPEDKTFAGDKWGGKYLRAPNVFLTLLEKGNSRLAKLGEVIRVETYLNTGGADGFYIVKAPQPYNSQSRILAIEAESGEEFEIETQWIRPFVKSPTELSSIRVHQQDAQYMLVTPPIEVDKKSALWKYIQWGERHGWHLKSGTSKRRPWWRLPPQAVNPGNVMWSRLHHERHLVGYNPDMISYTNFYAMHSDNPVVAAAILNSSLFAFLKEVMGKANFGGGVLKTDGNDIKLFPCIRLTSLTQDEVARLTSVFDGTVNEVVGSIRDEIQKDKRQQLDDVVFDLIGLSRDERRAVYEELIALVSQRVEKARSV
ncbi:hypothetical protein ANRL4_04427 [Anaerolineae bacterium]|nr:hypothetical protein ANRL4_04427 [Anaerolineae bacterium]